VPRVEIDTPGVTVRMEADEISVGELAKLAMGLYRDASAVDAGKSAGPATGFSVERSGE